MSRTYQLVAGLLVTAALVAACGGEDRPSKEEYIRQADAICADYDRRLDALIKDPTPSVTQQKLQSFIDEWKALTEEHWIKVKLLRRPRGEDPKLDEVFRTADEVVEGIRSFTVQNFVVRLAELGPPQNEAKRVAREYGFVECGNLGV